MTAATTQAQRNFVHASPARKIDWTAVTLKTFWAVLGTFWAYMAVIFFMTGGWAVSGGVLFTALSIVNFAMIGTI